MEHLSWGGTSSLREVLSTRDVNLYRVESGTGADEPRGWEGTVISIFKNGGTSEHGLF